jgi:hypothetical protein
LHSYDLELPVDCDDEFWENDDPSQAFKQPPSTPSRVIYYITTLKLLDILGFVLRTIVCRSPTPVPPLTVEQYSVKKAGLWTCLCPPDESVVVQVDSALNEWLDAIPEHRE